MWPFYLLSYKKEKAGGGGILSACNIYDVSNHRERAGSLFE